MLSSKYPLWGASVNFLVPPATSHFQNYHISKLLCWNVEWHFTWFPKKFKCTSTTCELSIACRLMTSSLNSKLVSVTNSIARGRCVRQIKMYVYVFKILSIEDLFKSSSFWSLALSILREGEEQLISSGVGCLWPSLCLRWWLWWLYICRTHNF